MLMEFRINTVDISNLLVEPKDKLTCLGNQASKILTGVQRMMLLPSWVI